MDLTPSQVIRKSTAAKTRGSGRQGSHTTEDSSAAAMNDQQQQQQQQQQQSTTNGGKKERKRAGKKQHPARNGTDTPRAETAENKAEIDSSLQQPPNAKLHDNQQPKKRNRNRRKKNNNSTDASASNIPTPAAQQPLLVVSDHPNHHLPANEDSKKKRNKHSRKRSDKSSKQQHRVHWRPMQMGDIPSLEFLEYPPFALVANEPYVVMNEWPIPDPVAEISARESEQDRQRRILAEQWGEQHTTNAVADDKAPSHVHVNLYDGRALAYYMVSQLQFIDPLNRRDLTRDEINHLDVYLRRHGFHDLNVTEAYDAKGITLSTAGAIANTAAGRAAILQQEARNLLNALFGNSSVAHTSSNNNNNNALMRQYLAHEVASTERYSHRQRNNTARSTTTVDMHESGIYGSDGFMIIDDTLNPGLRTDANPSNQEIARSNVLWSSSHITGQHGSGGVPRAWEFPSLATVAQHLPKTSIVARSSQRIEEKKLPSKTLSKIGNAIKKTDPEEVQRQFEAREEARRRAMMSNLTFGSNPSAMGVGIGNDTEYSAVTGGEGPSLAQLNRNRAFAEALGVVPSTVRGYSGSLNSGWARPSEGPQLDEFGKELNTTVYPDSLILQAREKVAVLLKLERKWKLFLADDTSASLPLNKMDRPTRAMVHEYAAFWKLHTESFDPEPLRYIHCVKLQETSAPFPLLSDAARAWRGPTFSLTKSDHPLQQTAGQITEGRSIPAPLERIPLSLKPRSDAFPTENTHSIALEGVIASNMHDQGSSRFDSLARDRPKLELHERTLPLVMPVQDEGFDIKKDLANQRRRAEEGKQKERKEAELRQRLLQEAFDSDDDHIVSRGDYDDDSDWEEQAPLYTGSDDS